MSVSDQPALDSLARIVGPVAERFTEAGYRIFLVGGVVRDLALSIGRPFDPAGNDVDLTTDATPTEIKRILSPLAEAIWDQGERFGTIGAMVDGQELEITTHRAEAYDAESRKPVVTFGHDLHEDLSRRDFTINAAAIELPGGELHDPYHGMIDLRVGVLRTPLSPEISFTDDPLRMMRAARFIPRFGLAPSPELTEAAIELADRLAIVSVERVADELERLIRVDEPRAGFEFLARTGLLPHVVPALAGVAASDIDLAVRLASAPGGPAVRRAGLLWVVRSDAAVSLSRLRFSRADTTETIRLLDGAAVGLGSTTGGTIDHATVRRIADRGGAALVAGVADLVDNIASADPEVDRDTARRLRLLIDEVGAEEDLDDLVPALSSHEVMDVLAIAPGPAVGQALAYLRNQRIERGPLGRGEAVELMLRWWRQEPHGDDSLP